MLRYHSVVKRKRVERRRDGSKEYLIIHTSFHGTLKEDPGRNIVSHYETSVLILVLFELLVVRRLGCIT
jgi:hypothetical protein